MLLESECRSLEPHFVLESPGPSARARRVRENDMTVMTSWDLFEDLRSAQDELVRMSRMPGQWLGQVGPEPGTSPPTHAGAPPDGNTQPKDAYRGAVRPPRAAACDQKHTVLTPPPSRQ